MGLSEILPLRIYCHMLLDCKLRRTFCLKRPLTNRILFVYAMIPETFIAVEQRYGSAAPYTSTIP